MARSHKEIKKLMTDNFISNPLVIEKYGLTLGNSFENEFSIVSLENILFDNIAFSIMAHEQTAELNALVNLQQNELNYKAMVASYVDGAPVIHINGRYEQDLSGLTEDEILARRIIKRNAVITTTEGIIVKIATEIGGVLQPVTNDQAASILYWISINTTPGVPITLINKAPDNLKVVVDVYIDPIAIEIGTGKLKNATDETFPVKDAIKEYLENIEFNGAFVKNKFEAQLESAAGVKLINLTTLEWQYESLPFVDAGIYRVSSAGYFVIDDVNLTINYMSYGSLA